LDLLNDIFAQPDAAAVDAQFDRIVATLDAQVPEVAAMLVEAREELLPSPPSLSNTGARSGPPTPSNDSTGR